MISQDFYPTTYDLTNPVRQLTDNIEYNPNGTATDIELSDAYWLGWMAWETFPDCWKFSTYTQTADTITIDFVTPSQNVNVGYVARRYTSAQSGRRWSNMYRRSEDDAVSMYSMGYPNQYLNKYDIMGCASIRQFWVQIFAACEYKTSSSATTYINSGIQLGSRYVDEYLSFFNGDSTLDFSLNVGSVGSVNISLDIANIEDDNTFVIEGTQGGYDYKIKAYFAFVCANTAPDVTSSGDYVTGVTATNIIPMIGVTIDGDYYLLCGDTSHFTQVLGQIQIQVLANYVFNPNQMFNNMLVGGYKAVIDKNEFNSMAVNNTYFSGNTAFVKTASGNSGILNRVLSPQEIMTIIGIMPRVGRGYDTTNIANYGYTENVIWATYVTEDNEFTATLITGDLSDDEFKAKLRPWQYDVDEWADNDYTEEDLPPYEPDGPGPTPQETEPKYPGYPTLGSATRYVPTAGVNFYALNNSLVSTFVQRLWSQPKNFYEAIQIAGNQVDSIFDYIQSFRYYPLRYDFSTNTTYPVIFGTGAVLKDSDGTTNFQLSEAYPIQTTVAAGEWNLSDPIYHWRNNFLDYSPYLKMSIYLPFAGTIELSPEAVASHSDISAATITLLASFDIETGTITYYVINQDNVLLAQKTAKVAIDLPLSGNNSAEQSAAILRAQFATVKQLLGAGTSIAAGAATSGLAGAATGAVSTISSLGDMYLQNSLAQRAVPVEVQGMGGTFSALAGGQYPYITINRQKVSNPPNYAHTTGYLVEGTYKISSLNGFTVCRNVDVNGIGQATDKEKAQIKQILESGFYA